MSEEREFEGFGPEGEPVDERVGETASGEVGPEVEPEAASGSESVTGETGSEDEPEVSMRSEPRSEPVPGSEGEQEPAPESGDQAAGEPVPGDATSSVSASGPAPEPAPEEPPDESPASRVHVDEPPTDWDYPSSGTGGPRRDKRGEAEEGGALKRNRRTVIAIVAVLVVAVVAAIAGVIALWPCDHEWAEATCTEPATCTKCGETEGEALGHDWEDATCTEPETCSRCGETQGEALGHDWEDATCTEPETCSVCGETQGDPLGHTVVEWTVDLEPTCGEEGSEHGVCTVCGEEVTEAIEPTGEHVEGEWSFTSSIGVKRLLCAVCGEVMESETVEAYNLSGYVVGVDLPAGEYKLYCTATSDEYGYDYGYYVVYADSSEEDLLVIEDVEDCAYLTLSDGQYVELDEVVMVPIEDAEPMSPETCEGVYKVGYDIEPGEYRITPEADVEFGAYYIWETSDAVSIDDNEWVEMDLLYSSATITVTEGQYLQLWWVESIELVD